MLEIVILGATTVIGYFTWKIYSSRAHLTLFKNVVETLMKESYKPNCVINDTQQSATLMYERMGKIYHLTVPYNRSIMANMVGKKVYLIKQTPEKEIVIDVTHQPGIPYLVTANAMGGMSFRITDSIDDVTVEVPGNVIPKM